MNIYTEVILHHYAVSYRFISKTKLKLNRENIDFSLSLKSYLFQSAKNRALNYLRDKKQKVSIDILKENSDEHYNSEEELEFKELQNLIKEAVCQLPTKCQTIF